MRLQPKECREHNEIREPKCVKQVLRIGGQRRPDQSHGSSHNQHPDSEGNTNHSEAPMDTRMARSNQHHLSEKKHNPGAKKQAMPMHNQG